MNIWRHSLKVLLAGVLIVGSAALAADAPLPNVFFWNSGGETNYVKSPAKWGNGDFSVSSAVPFDTLETLQVTTRNLREGVRFDLKNPLDIAPYMDKGVLRLRVKFASAGQGGGGSGAAPGRFGGRRRGGRRGAVNPAPAEPMMQPHTTGVAQVLPPFGGAPGQGGFGPVQQVQSSESTEIDHLQLTLMLERGVMSTVIDIPKRQGSGTDVDLSQTHADADGWMLFLIPLNSLNTTSGASGSLQRVILTSDSKDTYNVSQLGIVIATDKMSVSLRRQGEPLGTQEGEITVKPGRLTLVADVEAGDGDPLVTWNFDADNRNPLPTTMQTPGEPRIDARGLVATYNYPNEEQNYRVEVTVHDRTDKNPDMQTSLLIKVRNGD